MASARARIAAITAAGQEIGPLPPVLNHGRRQAADDSFRAFCETYFPLIFNLPWSRDHVRVIDKIERAVIDGDQFAVAMPRGFGKTTLCQAAALWALLTGRHRFVFLISATAEFALSALENLKTHLSGNELLLQDYPEAVFPIRAIEGESRRCGGQRYYGRLTHIEWATNQIVLPTIPGSRCSGAIVRTSGLLESVRGSLHVLPNGESVRPSLAIIDDPQTDQSAKSFCQVQERLGVINGAVLGLAGPSKKIAVVIPCTVIQCGDLADQLLDRTLHPEWHGDRTKLVYQFPTNERLWTQYARLRNESLRADGKGEEATELYRANRAAMDDGAVVAWPARFNPGEISALQHAMNLKLRNEAAFHAEYQNDPVAAVAGVDETVSLEQIRAKVNLLARGTAPLKAEHLTAAIDVHDEILYWVVCAWGDGFSGWVIDYGAWPDQHRPFWQHDKPPVPLSRQYAGLGSEATVRHALLDLTDGLCARTWVREDQGEMRVERVLIDAGFKPDQVCDVCRNSPHAAVLLPSRGLGITAARKPMAEYNRRPGDRLGWHWYLTPPQKGLRFAHLDTNYWKTFLQARWRIAVGDVGALSLFGREPHVHEMFASHLTAEIPTRVTANGRSLDEWHARPGVAANHWLDCVAMSAAAASLCGAALAGTTGAAVPVRKPRIRLSDLQRMYP